MVALPILTFHSIDTSGSVISISPSKFRKLIEKLKELGYKSLTLEDVIAWLKGVKEISERSIVITFDDGYENFYYHAFPILEDFGFKATLFLTTGYCGGCNNWPTQITNIPNLPMLGWEHVAEMARHDFDIQAHTRTHPVLSELPLNKVREELYATKVDIEDRLGQEVKFFAYPFGKLNSYVYEMVCQYFEAACSTRLDFVHLTSDRYLLERIDMYYFSGIFTSKIFTTSLLNPYLLLRQFIRNMYLKWTES